MVNATHKITIEIFTAENKYSDEKEIRSEWLGRLKEKCPDWDIENVKIEKFS